MTRVQFVSQSVSAEKTPPETVERFDFLSAAFNDATVTRHANEIRTSRPWTLIDFASHRVKPGWWRLQCETDAPLNQIEVRLRSAADPLIVIKADEISTARFFLRGRTEYNISLLVSPWPDAVAFRKLALVRLSVAETFRLFVGGVARLFSQDRPFTRVMRILRRLLAGQSFGIHNGGEMGATKRSIASGKPGDHIPAFDIERISLKKGDITAVIRAADVLHERAFELAGSVMAEHANIVAAYGDAYIDGVLMPNTGWDPLLASAGAYDCAPLFVRSALFNSQLPTLRNIAQVYGRDAVVHIPLPLVSGRSIPPKKNQKPGLRGSKTTSVSVIIPTKIRMDLLRTCLEGLSTTTSDCLAEVILVDNGVKDPSFRAIIDHASRRLKVVTIVDHGPFNFSRLVNLGVSASAGETVLLLNDDIEPTDVGWLDRMMESASAREVGVVGARLVYPSGLIQHAGVMMGLGGPCGHLWKGLSPEEADLNAHVSLPGQRMAVTGACMLVRRSVFDEVGGFDEQFAVAFNDIDFCLRVRSAGYTNIYRGDAVLVHHESQSRGLDDLDTARRKRLAMETHAFLSRWSHLTTNDPFGSPSFDPAVERGAPHRSLVLPP